MTMPWWILVTVSNALLRRVLVDSESSFDILFWKSFCRMGFGSTNLKPMLSQLVGFNN